MIKRNKKLIIILVFILAIILLGFIFASFFKQNVICTEMDCRCASNGEMPCNKCGVGKPVFILFIININKYCSAQEIIICENNLTLDRRIDIDKKSCKYRFQFFDFGVSY